jgi:hypothetical protein
MRGPWDYEDPRCKGIDTDIYYPPEEEQPRELKTIREICGNCTHKTECAEWGIRNERFGIWGGLTQAQRKRERSRRNITIPFGEFNA